MFTNSLSDLDPKRLDNLAEHPIHILVEGVNPIRKRDPLFPQERLTLQPLPTHPFSIIIRSQTQLSRASRALLELYPTATFTYQQEKIHAT